MRVDQIMSNCVESRFVSCAPELRNVVNAFTTTRSWGLASRLGFLNHDCATKWTYMDMKTRILIVGDTIYFIRTVCHS